MNLCASAKCLAVALVVLNGAAWADDDYYDASNTDRVAAASAAFVDVFNQLDSEGLGEFYAENGTLKLPNAPAVNGEDDIVEAWQGGFDAGLAGLELVSTFEAVSNRKVLENGSYLLTINTPDGPIVQSGTFAVLWRAPRNEDRPPVIIFDTIDAD
ncbi:MAG: DUF4440 domain-containing protein [Pseudomonadota bacterium]